MKRKTNVHFFSSFCLSPIFLCLFLFYSKWSCQFQSKFINSFGWTNLLDKRTVQKMNKDCLPLFFSYLFNMCILHLSFRICICQKHSTHEQICQSPTSSIKCISFSITFSASHISSEKHTHMNPDTKWDQSSIIWEIVTKFTLSMRLMMVFKLWYVMQYVRTEAGMLTTIHLPLISRRYRRNCYRI